MGKIFSEFWNGLLTSKLNNKWIKGIAIAVVLLLGAFILKVIFFPAVEKGELGNSVTDDWKDESRLIDKIKNGEEVEDNGEYSDSIETTIKLFFVGANESSLDLFSSVIDGKVLTNDFIFKVETDELMAKYNEAMARISRNGQIESVEIVGSNLMVGSNTRRVVVAIKYLDLAEPVRVGIEVTTYIEEDAHDEHVDSYKQPLVSQSIWDIIEIIEKGAK
ncbi:MAG: hypothetical protein KBT36_09145 [Kurthia sp.]|nr:hypothetical protein [Candidatus Kurthia equi]